MAQPQLVPVDELNQLHSAASIKEVSDNATEIHLLQRAAYAINNAANTGEYSAIYQGPMTDTLKSTLESEGYTLTSVDTACTSAPTTKISWRTGS